MAYTLSGITEAQNEYVMGGIKYVLLAKKSDVTFTFDDTKGTVSGITANPSGTTLNTIFKKYYPTKQTANYTVTSTGAVATGSLFYQHQLVLTFNKNEATKIAEMRSLAKNKLVAVCVGYCDGAEVGYLIGKDGLEIISGVGQSGVAPGDLNGQTITLGVASNLPELEVGSALLTTLQ